MTGQRLGGGVLSGNRLGDARNNTGNYQSNNNYPSGSRVGAGGESGNQLGGNQHQVDTYHRGNQIISETANTTTIPLQVGRAQRSGGFTRASMRDQTGARVIRTRRFIVNGQPVNESSTIITQRGNVGGGNQAIRVVINENVEPMMNLDEGIGGYGKFILPYDPNLNGTPKTSFLHVQPNVILTCVCMSLYHAGCLH